MSKRMRDRFRTIIICSMRLRLLYGMSTSTCTQYYRSYPSTPQSLPSPNSYS